MLQLARQLNVVVSKFVGTAVGLWGEPGIGKTHTAREVLSRVQCRHLSLHATTGAVQIVTMLPQAKKQPVWVQAQLARLERGEQPGNSTFAALLAAILSALAPFVLHLEDAHEASVERLDLIVMLAQSIARTRGVGLLVTGRSEPSAPIRNHKLEPLSFLETAALIEHGLNAPAPNDGLEWVFGRTCGNPLFTLEFVRFLNRQGFLWSDGESWHWRKPPEDFMPMTVEALISQLTLGLTTTPEIQAVLETRAILPDHLALDVLLSVWEHVAALERQPLLDAIGFLERGGVFNNQAFVHPLFAEITRRDLPAARRASYAERAMQVLEPIDLVLAADYIDDAGLEPVAAIERLERAASRLREQGDLDRAAHLLGMAAERASGEGRMRLALEADALFQTRGTFTPRLKLLRLAHGAQPDNRDTQLKLAMTLATVGQVEPVKALIAELPARERSEARWVNALFNAQTRSTNSVEALQTWRDHPELLQFPRSVAYAAEAYANLGDFQNAEHLIAQALEKPDPVGRHRNVIGMLAFIRSEQGRLEEAQQLHEQHLELALQAGGAGNIASSYYNRSFNLCRLGRYQQAIKSLEDAISLGDQAGVFEYSANARTVLGAILTRLGRFGDAEALILAGFETLSRLEVSHRLANAEWALADLYAQWRPPHGAVLALKFARDAVQHSRELANVRCLGAALAVAARIEAWLGDPVQALKLALEANALGLTSLTDVGACEFALATALEANGQPDAALLRWQEIARKTAFIEDQREAELAIARLRGDRRRGLELLEWFERRGLGAIVLRTRRDFLTEEIEPVQVSFTTARIEVLGAIRLFRNDQPVITRAHKRLEILSYLLETRISGRSEANTRELVVALYPNMPELEAKKALKQLVYLNRSVLGVDSLVSTAGGYALGAISSDAEDFLQTGDSSLWRGVYQGSLEDNWLLGVRNALTTGLQTSVESLFESNPNEAARLGLILLEMEPYNAKILRLTLACLERAGHLKRARSVYAEGYSRLLEVGELLPETMDGFLTPQPSV